MECSAELNPAASGNVSGVWPQLQQAASFERRCGTRELNKRLCGTSGSYPIMWQWRLGQGSWQASAKANTLQQGDHKDCYYHQAACLTALSWCLCKASDKMVQQRWAIST